MINILRKGLVLKIKDRCDHGQETNELGGQKKVNRVKISRIFLRFLLSGNKIDFKDWDENDPQWEEGDNIREDDDDDLCIFIGETLT